ncbi:DUF58 domain-containing protein [Natronomonas sp. LN261]|uniref:DUF58 domain-containing protein n=1 Tax=Natronomonas sp. LN261 TaxID=2750669 RepID=UPI0015EFA341|nr:DUF58 domain-containing protein [Natronomonas sp. LN261]
MVGIRRIRPTKRAIGTAVVVASALALAGVAGPRSLPAVAVPGAVALLAGGVQVALADPPTVTREAPDPGSPGERRTVAVTVDAETPCTVVESVGRGVSLRDPSAEVVTAGVGHGGSFEYVVELEYRGEHRLGPATCLLADSLGLFRAAVDADAGEPTTVLVHPEVYGIDPEATPRLRGGRDGNDRSAFDRLRAYTPEDAIRNIHWRASAKRPDGEFVVAEYGGPSATDRVTVVGESTPDGADAMASAVASLAAYFSASGITTAVVVPDGECLVPPGGVDAALRLLARTDGGTCLDAERARADVRVHGGAGRRQPKAATATLTVADRTFGFDTLVDPPERRAGRAVR